MAARHSKKSHKRSRKARKARKNPETNTLLLAGAAIAALGVAGYFFFKKQEEEKANKMRKFAAGFSEAEKKKARDQYLASQASYTKSLYE